MRLQVFPPSFRDLPPPSLELFDLDEAFSSEKVRMAQLTNECKSSVCLHGRVTHSFPVGTLSVPFQLAALTMLL